MRKPDGEYAFQSFSGLLSDTQIREGVQDLIIDVIDNYPPTPYPNTRLANKEEAEEAMQLEVMGKSLGASLGDLFKLPEGKPN